jgi:hypothetical protein
MAVVRLEFDNGALGEGGEVDANAPIEREGKRELESLGRVRDADDCVDACASVREGSRSGKKR